MKNNKGFTLVELLAMLVVLGILMAVAVPNITGILGQTKENGLRQDAIKMINAAKLTFSKNKKIKYPQEGNCVLFSLNYLDTNNDFEKGANGGEYLPFDSYVIVKREGSRYVYYVRLNEKLSNGKYIGIPITTEDKLTAGKDVNYGTITGTTLGEGTVGKTNAWNASSIVREKCQPGTLEEYYK